MSATEDSMRNHYMSIFLSRVSSNDDRLDSIHSRLWQTRVLILGIIIGLISLNEEICWYHGGLFFTGIIIVIGLYDIFLHLDIADRIESGKRRALDILQELPISVSYKTKETQALLNKARNEITYEDPNAKKGKIGRGFKRVPKRLDAFFWYLFLLAITWTILRYKAGLVPDPPLYFDTFWH